MFTDDAITRATEACGQLREHLVRIANDNPDDAWWAKRVATADALVADLVAKRNAGR